MHLPLTDLSWKDLWPLLALAALAPLLVGVQLAFVVRAIRAMRVVAPVSTPVEEADVPAAAREAVAAAEAEIVSLGFLPRGWYRVDGVIAGTTAFQRVFRGDDGPTWLVVQPASMPTGGRPCDVVAATVRADGEGLITMYGEEGRMLGRMPQTTPHGGYHDGVAAQLTAHRARLASFLAGQPAVRLTDAELAERSARQMAGYVPGLVADGLVEPADGGLRVRWPAALRAARTSVRELRRWRAHQKRLGTGGAARLSAAQEADAFRRVAARPKPLVLGVAARWAVFTGSLTTFWLTLGYLGVAPGSAAAAWLVGALVLHEAGHLAAMRAFGYATPQMVFLPLLGAVTIGRPGPEVSARRRALVYLAGPLPGLVLGCVAVALHLWGHVPGARLAALMLLAVNLPNMLPVVPLDGGRLLALLAPRLSIAMVVAGIGLELAFAWSVRDRAVLAGVVFALAALTVLSLRGQLRMARLMDRLPAAAAGEDRVETVFAILREPPFERVRFDEKVHFARAALDAPPPLRLGESIALLALYIAGLGVPVAFGALAWYAR